MVLLLVLVVALAIGGPAGGAATSAGTTLTLEKTEIAKTGMLYPEAWSVSAGSASWKPYFGTANYMYAMPGSIPAAGTSMTLSVNVIATAPNRFAPALAIEGSIVQGGRVQVGALAEAGKSAAASKSVKLLPGSVAAGSTVKVVVGLQDGPRITYTYRAAGGSTTPKEDCSKYRGLASVHRAAAINEVRVVCVEPDVQVHREGAPDDEWQPVKKGDVLKQGDEISCDPDGVVVLAFADNSTVKLKNTTQLKIASFFTEGGVVRTLILLQMGEVAAKVNKSEATKSDFQIKGPSLGSVRGTTFSVFRDPVGKAEVWSVREGIVELHPTGGRPLVTLRAKQEVEVTPTTVSKIAPIGKAGAPKGSVSRSVARGLVLKQIAKVDERCKLEVTAYGLKTAPHGWLVSVKVKGKKSGWGVWRVLGKKATPSNALAKAIVSGCR